MNNSTAQGTGIDYVRLIADVLTDEKALALANGHWAKIAADIYTRNEGRNGLRVSDAGRCVRELWADLHNKFDLPESAKGLAKMRDGSRSGAENACLIVAGIERWLPFYAKVEVEVEDVGIPGHADVVVYDDTTDPHTALEVVECKRTMWTGAYEPPHEKNPYQCFQAGKYALAVGAKHFVILTDSPAAMRGEPMNQRRYDTEEWASEVDMEYSWRLDAALGDIMPEGDPQEKWRCKSCRFAACERNENPLRKAAAHVV